MADLRAICLQTLPADCLVYVHLPAKSPDRQLFLMLFHVSVYYTVSADIIRTVVAASWYQFQVQNHRDELLLNIGLFRSPVVPQLHKKVQRWLDTYLSPDLAWSLYKWNIVYRISFHQDIWQHVLFWYCEARTRTASILRAKHHSKTSTISTSRPTQTMSSKRSNPAWSRKCGYVTPTRCPAQLKIDLFFH